MTTPDFTKLFYDSFKGLRKKLAYKTRKGAAFGHDIIFLDSLIHDAQFDSKGIVIEKRTVTITLLRYRWEEGRQEDTKQLLKTNSILKFSNVSSVRWVSQNVNLPTRRRTVLPNDLINDADTSYEISRLFIGESTYLSRGASNEIILTGYPGLWQLRLFTTKDESLITLKDSA